MLADFCVITAFCQEKKQEKHPELNEEDDIAVIFMLKP